MEERFTIPGDPVGKQRPKAAFQQRRIYTPSKTINYENFVKYCYYGHKHFGERPVEMAFDIYLPIPKSVSRKRAIEMDQGKVRPAKKPDFDNVIKSICDGLNGVAYDDDKQIVEVSRISKRYGRVPRVDVTIKDWIYLDEDLC